MTPHDPLNLPDPPDPTLPCPTPARLGTEVLCPRLETQREACACGTTYTLEAGLSSCHAHGMPFLAIALFAACIARVKGERWGHDALALLRERWPDAHEHLDVIGFVRGIIKGPHVNIKVFFVSMFHYTRTYWIKSFSWNLRIR